MNKNRRIKTNSDGVSIISCTKRAEYIYNLFNNSLRQKWRKKELIIIINNDRIKLRRYKELAKRYKHVSVYRLKEKTSLGKCLNFGVKKSKFNFIAKFDDDDYYAPSYLTESMQIFKKKNVDVVGKRAHFLWLSGSRILISRFPKSENKYVNLLPGATLVIKKSVFKKVPFRNITNGEDDMFCLDCISKGFKIYSGSKYNFAAFRRKFSKNHTWIISEKELISYEARIFPNIKNYKKFVSK